MVLDTSLRPASLPLSRCALSQHLRRNQERSHRGNRQVFVRYTERSRQHLNPSPPGHRCTSPGRVLFSDSPSNSHLLEPLGTVYTGEPGDTFQVTSSNRELGQRLRQERETCFTRESPSFEQCRLDVVFSFPVLSHVCSQCWRSITPTTALHLTSAPFRACGPTLCSLLIPSTRCE